MTSNIPFFYKCKSCGQRGQTNDGREACAKFKIVINPEEDFCSWHTTKDSSKCAFCGSADNLILYDIGNDDHLIVCSKCYPALFSCQTCANAQDCLSVKKIIRKVVRIGNYILNLLNSNPYPCAIISINLWQHMDDRNCVHYLEIQTLQRQ